MTPYADSIAADSYFAERLYVIAWNEASRTNKNIALIEASRRINHLRFSGDKVDENQELEFPRYYGDEPDGTETIPNDIKIACFELAYALLDGADPDLAFENLRIIGSQYGTMRANKDSSFIPEHILAGIPSYTAWRYLMPYLAKSSTVRITRI